MPSDLSRTAARRCLGGHLRVGGVAGAVDGTRQRPSWVFSVQRSGLRLIVMLPVSMRGSSGGPGRYRQLRQGHQVPAVLAVGDGHRLVVAAPRVALESARSRATSSCKFARPARPPGSGPGW